MTSRLITAAVTAALAVATFGFGCGAAEEPVEKEPAAVTAAETPEEVVPVPPEPEADKMKPKLEPTETKPQAKVGVSEEKTYATGHRWAEGKKGLLLKGLDGGLYSPYAFGLIKEVQQTLTDKGLYSGGVNGYLNEETMEALGAFQRGSGLAVSGVPTPRTRELLLVEAPNVT